MSRADRLDPAPLDVDGARTGAPGAWAGLVDAWGPAVWGLCRRLTPDAEDAYQDVWERVARSLDAWDAERGTLGAWIVTITHRVLIDRHRRRKVRGEVVELPDLADPAGPVDERLVAASRAAALERALLRLPEAHRRVVVLHHQHGVPLEQIALEEGVALGTVKSRLHRARARLVTLMAEDA
jgi:RNA polymerase sigma-70 factor (ECF subfamily)